MWDLAEVIESGLTGVARVGRIRDLPAAVPGHRRLRIGVRQRACLCTVGRCAGHDERYRLLPRRVDRQVHGPARLLKLHQRQPERPAPAEHVGRPDCRTPDDVPDSCARGAERGEGQLQVRAAEAAADKAAKRVKRLRNRLQDATGRELIVVNK